MSKMSEQQNTKDDIRNRLLETGITLIQEQGYHGTGLSDLVKHVGVPKGSFYYYFNSKEQFVADTVLHYTTPFLRSLESIEKNNEVSTLRRLRQYFQDMADSFDKDSSIRGCLLGNLLGEIGDTSELALNALDSAVSAYRGSLRRLLRRAQAEGSIRKDIDSDQLANLLFDSWQGALLRMKVDRSTQPLSQFIEITFDSLLLKK